MPIYEYRCAACGHQQDFLQRLSDAPLTDCPECGKPAFSKQVTAAGFQLKGTGWYATDFKNSGAKSAEKQDPSATGQDKPAAKQDKAATGQDKPAANQDKTAAGQDKPAAKQDKSTESSSKESTKTDAPAAPARPAAGS